MRPLFDSRGKGSSPLPNPPHSEYRIERGERSGVYSARKFGVSLRGHNMLRPYIHLRGIFWTGRGLRYTKHYHPLSHYPLTIV